MSAKSEEICKAARSDKVKQVKRMIRENPELVNARDKLEWTPLHFAVANGSLKMVKFLLSKGANVNAKASMGETPLHIANCLEIAKLLILKGADINSQDDSGVTALGWAVVEGNEELVDFVISVGGKIPGAKVMKVSDSKWN